MTGTRTVCRRPIALLLCLAASVAGRAAEDPRALILGNWMTSDKSGIIQIAALPDGSYEGRIVGGNQPERRDTKNPDAALRDRELLDLVVLSGLHYDGNGKWSGGTIYDPNSGRSYHCSAELRSVQELKLHGYVGISLLGRNELWTRYLGTEMRLPPPR